MTAAAAIPSDPSYPLALIEARRWIGTPYVLGAALRGVGCDCIGLVRGVYGALMGCPPPPVPGWRADWADDAARPLVSAARRYLHPIPPATAATGDVVVLRHATGREAHCGILADAGGLIHAVEGVGVALVPFATYRPRVAFAARFPVQ